jgi:transposase
VIVLDNYAVHCCGVVKDEMPALAAEGISFFFLPAYCPWLNEIEPLWRQVKRLISSTRTCQTVATRRRRASERRSGSRSKPRRSDEN